MTFRYILGFNLYTQTISRRTCLCRLIQHSYIYPGRTTPQAASRWLPTAETLVRVQVRSCGICGRQSGARTGFLRVLRFLLPILIPPTTPHSLSIIRGLVQEAKQWATYQMDSVSPHPKKLKRTKLTTAILHIRIASPQDLPFLCCWQMCLL
jgi:hypothetical protein